MPAERDLVHASTTLGLRKGDEGRGINERTRAAVEPDNLAAVVIADIKIALRVCAGSGGDRQYEREHALEDARQQGCPFFCKQHTTHL